MKPIRERNTFAFLLLVVVLGAIGVFLMVWGDAGDSWPRAVSLQLGVAIVVGLFLSGLWELKAKRMFAQELHEQFNLSADVEQFALKRVSMNWSDDADWAKLFTSTKDVDLFLAYGYTWRGVKRGPLKQFTSKKGNRLRVCLPDPTCDWAMKALSVRFATTEAEVATRIRAAAREFLDLREIEGADIRIHFRKGEPLFAAYRFGSEVVVTLYSNRRMKCDVPVLVASAGDFSDFVTKDLDIVFGDSREVPESELRGSE